VSHCQANAGSTTSNVLELLTGFSRDQEAWA
jgi:hypothetical protein